MVFNNLNPVYRLLNKDEFDKYRNLWLECLKTYPDNFGPSYEEESRSKTLKFSHLFTDSLSDDFIFGAFIEDELIGMCGFTTERMMKTKHRGHITQMFVKKNFGGKGIGSKLLASTIEKAFSCPTIEQITLTVVSTNESAITTYKKQGFIQYGLLENCIKSESGYVADLFFVLMRDLWKGINQV